MFFLSIVHKFVEANGCFDLENDSSLFIYLVDDFRIVYFFFFFPKKKKAIQYKKLSNRLGVIRDDGEAHPAQEDRRTISRVWYTVEGWQPCQHSKEPRKERNLGIIIKEKTFPIGMQPAAASLCLNTQVN